MAATPWCGLACLDDDANGQITEVFWEREVDARILGQSTWETIGQRGFDDPRVFSSYLHTLQWNCVTATDPGLFQAPLRAGIDVKPYQLEPLRKALRMPRVALFIADDVGLGKTIEAGLIMRELLLRQKAQRVVVVAPPSVLLQWQGEMESRFAAATAAHHDPPRHQLRLHHLIGLLLPAQRFAQHRVAHRADAALQGLQEVVELLLVGHRGAERAQLA